MGNLQYPQQAYHGQPHPRGDQMLYAAQQEQRQRQRPRSYVVYNRDIEMVSCAHQAPWDSQIRRKQRESYYYREPPRERNDLQKEDGHCWCCG